MILFIKNERSSVRYCVLLLLLSLDNSAKNGKKWKKRKKSSFFVSDKIQPNERNSARRTTLGVLSFSFALVRETESVRVFWGLSAFSQARYRLDSLFCSRLYS
jgi:hypothetical protein